MHPVYAGRTTFQKWIWWDGYQLPGISSSTAEQNEERQREGIEIAKAKSKYKGRKPVAVNEAKFRAVCARWRAGEITAAVAMHEVGLNPNTFYRRVKKTGL